jgi:hypothetical protein
MNPAEKAATSTRVATRMEGNSYKEVGGNRGRSVNDMSDKEFKHAVKNDLYSFSYTPVKDRAQNQFNQVMEPKPTSCPKTEEPKKNIQNLAAKIEKNEKFLEGKKKEMGERAVEIENLAQKENILSEKDKALSEKDKVLSEKDKALSAKEKALDTRQAQIARQKELALALMAQKKAAKAQENSAIAVK